MPKSLRVSEASYQPRHCFARLIDSIQSTKLRPSSASSILYFRHVCTLFVRGSSPTHSIDQQNITSFNSLHPSFLSQPLYASKLRSTVLVTPHTFFGHLISTTSSLSFVYPLTSSFCLSYYCKHHHSYIRPPSHNQY